MDIRFNPYDPAFDADPFPVYHRLREDAPCFWSEDARMWVLTRYEDISRALGDWRSYSSSKGNLMDEFPGRAGNTLGSMDPPRHDRSAASFRQYSRSRISSTWSSRSGPSRATRSQVWATRAASTSPMTSRRA